MSQRSRNFLFTGPFANGERPDEKDFGDVWDSFINFEDDPVSVQSGDFVFDQGIRVNNTSSTALGTIRFNGNVFEFLEQSGWRLLGSGGAFQAVGGTPHVAFNTGRVGIGTGTTPTNYLFEVRIGNNTGEANQIRLGSAVIHDRNTGTPDRAYFSHFQRANENDFALRQRDNGEVNVNAPTTEAIRFSQNGTDVRMAVLANSGNVVVGSASVNSTVLTGNPNARLFISGDGVVFNGTTFISISQLATRITSLEARVTALGG